MTFDRQRRRSVGFLDRDGERWACFLVTFRDESLKWHGYFSFRPPDGEAETDEVRTADIFLESSQEEIDRKARELGRPLLGGLLSSALHTAERDGGRSSRLRSWFREMLSENSRELAGGWEPPAGVEAPGASPDGPSDRESPDGPPDAQEEDRDDARLARLRSLYESYRLDQAVDRILDGRSVDFGARDRLQFAMMIVEHIEDRLPLPPFDVWVRDYLDHPDAYRLYAHTLHREGRLP